MKISTRAHYGLRAVIAIAKLAGQGGPVSVNDVAQTENLSNTYLEQLVSKLRRAGILRSYRGARGGYEMLRDPDDLTVAEVLKAAGEQIIFPECTTPEGCERARCIGRPCASSCFWRDVSSAVNRIAQETTVGDLLRRHEDDAEAKAR